jgi:hypothetical protein
MVTKKDNEKDQNTEPERNEKGHFVKGHAGGPGRGKKKIKIDFSDLDNLEVAEKLIMRDTYSSNPAIRQKAYSSLVQLTKLKQQMVKKPEQYEGFSPIMRKLIIKISETNSQEIEPEFLEIIKDH